MSVIARASRSYLTRHPWQLGLAMLGIALGVAVMVAVDLANESSRAAFFLSLDTVNGRATHQVVGGPGGLDERLYADLRVRHGQDALAPVVSGYADLQGESLQVLGIDIFAERPFRRFSAPGSLSADVAGADGRDQPQRLVRSLLTEPGSMLIAAGTARQLGLAAGNSIELVASGKPVAARIAGVFGDRDDPRYAGIAVVDIATAQAWFGMAGRLSRIDVRLPPGDDGEVLRRLLPADARLLAAAGRTETTAQMSQAFLTNLSAMSLLALLIGLFLIYNGVSFAVLQRRDLIAMLRALGMQRADVVRLILGEALLLGAIGSVAGAVLGLWLGERMVGLVARSINDHFFAVSVTGVSLNPMSFVKGIVAGMAAALAAAGVPAIEAAASRPRLALSRSLLESQAGSRAPALAALGGLVLCAAIGLLLVSGRNLVAGLGALFLLIIGYALCVPAAVKFVSSQLAARLGTALGTASRLAVGGVGSALSRTGIAIVALTVAVSATIGVSIMVGSFRHSVEAWLDSSLQADLYVGVPRGSLDPSLITDIVGLSGVRAYSTSRRAWLESDGERTRLFALQPADDERPGMRIRGADPAAAWAAFDAGAVLISDAYSYAHGVGAGDTLALPTASGTHAFDVAGVYQSYDVNSGIVMMGRSTYDRWFADPAVDSVGLYLDVAADPVEVGNRVRALADGRQSVVLNGNRQIRDLSLGIFDRTFVITNVLYWLAVLVAVVGILGATMAMHLERGREFGILRSIGMTPREIGFLVGGQSAFMGLLAGMASIPLGTAMAWILISVINRRAFGWHIDMVPEAGPMVFAVLLAIAAALAAGIYPAWRVARAAPATLLQDE